MSGRSGSLLMLGLSVGTVLSIVAAVLFSTAGQSGGARAAGGFITEDGGQPVGPGDQADGPTSGLGVPRPTITANGAALGYRTRVRVIPAPDAASVLDVELSTEGTPASAPTAQAQLQGPGADRRSVALTVTGAGRWQSQPVSLVHGLYRLTIRFDRRGGPLSIPVQLRVP